MGIPLLLLAVFRAYAFSTRNLEERLAFAEAPARGARIYKGSSQVGTQCKHELPPFFPSVPCKEFGALSRLPLLYS